MRNRIALLSLAVAAFGCGATYAADNGFYLGAGVGKSDYDLPGGSQDDTSFKAIAGLRILDSFGVEANYADHGEVTRVGTTVKAKTASAFAVGFLDFPVVDLFAKAGLSYSDGSIRSTVISGLRDDDSSTEFAWGGGVQAHFLSFAVRAEYERFKVYDRDLETISASLIYTFL